jgi:hypothetical protein
MFPTVGLRDSVLDPKFAFFTNEAWFHLNGCINTQDNRYWNTVNHRHTFEVPLHNQKVVCGVPSPLHEL